MTEQLIREALLLNNNVDIFCKRLLEIANLDDLNCPASKLLLSIRNESLHNLHSNHITIIESNNTFKVAETNLSLQQQSLSNKVYKLLYK